MKHLSLILIGFSLFLGFVGESFATKDTSEGSGKTTIAQNQSGAEDISTGETTLNPEEQAAIMRDLNTYIIESYKAQGDMLLKDLDAKLIELLPDGNDRREAYMRIRQAFEIRNKRVENMRVSENRKLILKEFLGYLVKSIDKRIEKF